MSVGERIRYLRKLNGVKSQEELAYLVDTARQTISSWERDICLPEGANLLKLAKVLNTSVAYISGETPQPEPAAPHVGGGPNPHSSLQQGQTPAARARRAGRRCAAPEPRKRQGRLLAERRVARTDSYIDGKKLERQNGALRAPA